MLAPFLAEFRKLRQRPAVWASFAILYVLEIAIGYLVTYIVYSHPPPTMQLPRGITVDHLKQALYPLRYVQNTLGGGAQIGGVIAMIVGVLTQGSEYGWSTLKTIFTQRPSRLSVLAGKLAAIAVVTLVAAAGMLALGAITSYVLATVDGRSTAFPSATTQLKGLLALWLVFYFWSIFGIALATLFQQSALAIGLGLAYGLVIEGLIFGLLDQFGGDSVRSVHQWFPIASANSLVQSFGSAATIREAAIRPLADATHGVVMLFVYTAAFIAAAAYLTRARDVS